MAEPVEGPSGRTEATKLTAQILAFAKSNHRPDSIDLCHLITSQWLHSHIWGNNTIWPVPAGIELDDMGPAIAFPPEWLNRESFDEAMNEFNLLVNPYVPSWLLSVILCRDPVFKHDIIWPVKKSMRGTWVDVDSDSVETRFIRKCADVAYSVVHSKRGREALEKILKDIVTQWDGEGESHSFQYGRRNKRRFRQASDTVDYFLDVLRLMPPTFKLQEVGNIEGSWVHGRMIPTESRTEPVALDDFVPQEFEISIHPNVSNPPFPVYCSLEARLTRL